MGFVMHLYIEKAGCLYVTSVCNENEWQKMWCKSKKCDAKGDKNRDRKTWQVFGKLWYDICGYPSNKYFFIMTHFWYNCLDREFWHEKPKQKFVYMGIDLRRSCKYQCKMWSLRQLWGQYIVSSVFARSWNTTYHKKITKNMGITRNTFSNIPLFFLNRPSMIFLEVHHLGYFYNCAFDSNCLNIKSN